MTYEKVAAPQARNLGGSDGLFSNSAAEISPMKTITGFVLSSNLELSGSER